MALTTAAKYLSASNGLGSKTHICTFGKTSITEDEIAAAIKFAEDEGNSVAGIEVTSANSVAVALQGAGITAGSNYGVGSTGVTAAVAHTFEL
jgi:hypothetical protein|tara:strand:- start:1152 stop:1430 length:279 start_codon:yes stop_codon:yes gene_type:complete